MAIFESRIEDQTSSTANATANAHHKSDGCFTMAANFKNHGPQSGMSLVALLVAIGILGVLSVMISKSFKANLDVSQKINDRAAAEDLRQYIRIQLDCAQTISSAPSGCNTKTWVALKRSDAGDLVKMTQPYTKVGDFSLRAYCFGNPKTYNLDYARTPKDATSQLIWETKPLFKIPVVCP